ncbi:MAG: iron-containing alcohol dehydrogenase [Rikenellaceae bacterium]|nr:iron-containing alcohol dehydrogenase [Rikenellaceae bacterium]
MDCFDFYLPTRILFGAGKLDELARVALPGRKALIVTTGGQSVRKYGYLGRVIALLAQNGGVESVVFDKVLPNPVRSHVMEAAALCREHGCDFVVGLGGGSAIDSAKSIALMARNPGDYWDYVQGGSGLGRPVMNGALPVIAITTTAGTGTEADPWTVITHDDNQEKVGYGGDLLFPALSIVDPELMLTVPPRLTAYQGFDAFFHAAEGYIANIANPVSDMFALRSMRLIYDYLPTAVARGDDLEARTQVAMANTFAGIVESTSSCTSEHSLEHAMSGIAPDLPHGAGLIMISLAYFRHFARLIPERVTEMARNLGIDVDALPGADRPMAFVRALERMQKACGVDQLRMSEYGITPADFPRLAALARHAMGGLFSMDRAPLTDAAILQIFEESYK